MLSKTAAKRQAHRESSMHRQPGAGWTVTAISEPAKAYTLGHGLSFAGARRKLAAWRAARVRELMGVRPGVTRYPRALQPGEPGYIPPGRREDCPARSPEDGGATYLCTLDRGHASPHVAHLSTNAAAATWPVSSKTSAPPAAPEARGDSSPRGEKGGTGRPCVDARRLPGVGFPR